MRRFINNTLSPWTAAVRVTALSIALAILAPQGAMAWFGGNDDSDAEMPEWNVPEAMLERLEVLGMEPGPFIPADSKPFDAEADALLESRRYYMLGAWYLARNEYDSAQDAFEEARKSAPDSAAIRIGIARAHLYQKHADRTVAICTEILEADPHAVEAWLLLAQAHEVGGDLDKAVEAYRHGLEDMPESLSLLRPLGDIYRRRGDIPNTIDAFERIHHRLRKEQRRNLWVMVVLAQFYELGSQRDKAIEAYREAVDVYPTHVQVYRLYIAALLKFRKNDEALTACKQALIRAPGDEKLQALFVRACGSSADAAKQFRTFADEYEQISEVQAMWGVMARRLGDLEGVEEAFRRVLLFDAKHFDALNGLGRALQDRGRNDESMPLFERAIAAYPDRPEAYRNLARAHNRKGQFAKAIEQYNHALRLAPDSQQTYEEMAVAFALLGKPDEAIDVLENALERFREPKDQAWLRERLGEILMSANRAPEAAASFRKALEINQKELRLYRHLMGAYLAAGEDGKLNDLVAQGREVFASHREGFEALLKRVYSDRHQALMAGRRYEQAEASLNEAAQMFGVEGQWRIALYRAELLIEQDRLDDAIGHMQPWIEKIRNGDSPELMVKLSIMQLYALALGRAERLNEAIRVCDSMLEGSSDKQVEQVHLARGFVLFDLEAWDKARESFEVLTEHSPKNDGYHYRLGAIYDQLHKPDRAEASLRRSIELKPNNPDALNHLGYMFADEGRNLEEALGLIQNAMRLKPDQGHITDSLGWTYFKLGDAGNAVKRLEEAARLSGDDPLVFDHLADAYRLNGDLKKAIENWEKALELEADQSTVKVKLQEAREALK